MKLSEILRAKNLKSLLLMAVFFFSVGNSAFAEGVDGEKVFKANCASCHKPDKKFVGPALKGVQGRWEENSSVENMYSWIKNSQKYVKSSGDVYAKQVLADYNGSIMTSQSVSDEEIVALLEYVEGYAPKEKVAAPTVGENSGGSGQESSSWIWWVIGSLLIVVIFAVRGVGQDLKNANLSSEGKPVDESESYLQTVRRWLWANFNYVLFAGAIAVIGISTIGMGGLNQIGVFEDYSPNQPIKYSHKLHAGDLGIECKYCHNTVEKSKTAGIPTVNVCMNCHKGVSEGGEYGTTEIAKIYEAAGFDPELLAYTGETEPIRWVKVHNLPDHVYFSHSQHVKVGGLDCMQCHGDMKKETIGRVMTYQELNALEDNKIKFTRPTLTMGWCIECHGQKEVSLESAEAGSYYEEIHKRLLTDKETYQKYKEDGKVTVAELGGWECAKCHY